MFTKKRHIIMSQKNSVKSIKFYQSRHHYSLYISQKAQHQPRLIFRILCQYYKILSYLKFGYFFISLITTDLIEYLLYSITILHSPLFVGIITMPMLDSVPCYSPNNVNQSNSFNYIITE